jgi:hypothetical protein
MDKWSAACRRPGETCESGSCVFFCRCRLSAWMSLRVRICIESCQRRGASQSKPRIMARRVKDYTYTEHPERIIEGGVARRNTGKDIVAPQIAFKERTAHLVEKMVDFSESPV